MLKHGSNTEMTNLDDTNPIWPNVKTDAIISVVLSYLSVVIGGLGIYVITITWKSFPLIIIACILWGVSSVGLRRL